MGHNVVQSICAYILLKSFVVVWERLIGIHSISRLKCSPDCEHSDVCSDVYDNIVLLDRKVMGIIYLLKENGMYICPEDRMRFKPYTIFQNYSGRYFVRCNR